MRDWAWLMYAWHSPNCAKLRWGTEVSKTMSWSHRIYSLVGEENNQGTRSALTRMSIR